MIQALTSLIAGILTLVLASPLCACEAAVDPRTIVRHSIQLKSDGSFNAVDFKRSEKVGFNRWLGWWVEGRPIVDIGNGRVGQKITASFNCSINETLLFVDCTAADAIVVLGAPADFTFGGGELNVISEIQHPKGPIKLTSSSLVTEVEAVARKHDFYYERDVMKRPRSMIKSQRYDPFFGCKLFYPDSEGAKQKL